jgi:hypothetical protein
MFDYSTYYFFKKIYLLLFILLLNKVQTQLIILQILKNILNKIMGQIKNSTTIIKKE